MFSRNLLAYALFLLSLFQLGLVSARPQFPQHGKRDADPSVASNLRTNAARMAVGLPPLKPRNLYTPSRVQVGPRHAGASPVPYSGKIRIRKYNQYSSSPGYLRNMYHNSGRIRIHSSNDLLTVAFSVSPSSTGPLNIALTNVGSAWPYLGVAGSTLSSTSTSLVNWLVGTNPTSQGAAPTSVGNSAFGNKPNSESMIWYYNSVTKELSAAWINSGGGAVNVNFFYIASGPNEGVYVSGASSITGVPGAERCRLYVE